MSDIFDTYASNGGFNAGEIPMSVASSGTGKSMFSVTNNALMRRLKLMELTINHIPFSAEQARLVADVGVVSDIATTVLHQLEQMRAYSIQQDQLVADMEKSYHAVNAERAQLVLDKVYLNNKILKLKVLLNAIY